MEEKIIERIKKLFALSGNNENEEECKSAILKAQLLMAKYKIDESLIGFEEKEEVDNKKYEENKSLSVWKVQLARIICDNFRCSAIKTKFPVSRQKNRRTGVKIIGLKEDVDVVMEIYTYTLCMIERYSNEKLISCGIRKNDYAHGFISGLSDMFEEQKENVLREYALVTNTPEVVKNYVEELKLKTDTTTTKITRNEGYLAGYQDGKEFSPFIKHLEKAIG
jgi:hypothetical protein